MASGRVRGQRSGRYPAQRSERSRSRRIARSAAERAANVSGKRKREGTRINQKRLNQLTQAKPEVLALGCPFCMTMMEDAVKSRSLEDSMSTRDLAELVAESLGIL